MAHVGTQHRGGYLVKLALATFVGALWVAACGESSDNAGDNDSGSVDCSNASCALSICGEECTAPCGCCDCLPGSTTQRGGRLLTCLDGCFGDNGLDGGNHVAVDGSDNRADGSDIQNDASDPMAVSPCPAGAPSQSAACTGDTTCTYLDCEGDGMTTASCINGQWSVTTTPCQQTQCISTPCDAGMVCVQHVSGAFFAECAPNPCGTGPITCECAASLCVSGECSTYGTTVTCNSCPSGLCP